MIDTFSGCMRVVMETLCCDIKLHIAKMVCRKWTAVAFIVWHLLCTTCQTNWTLALQHFNASDGTWHAFTTLLFYCFTLIFSTSLSPIKRTVIIYARNKYILSTHTNWKQESFCFSNNFSQVCLVTVGFNMHHPFGIFYHLYSCCMNQCACKEMVSRWRIAGLLQSKNIM